MFQTLQKDLSLYPKTYFTELWTKQNFLQHCIQHIVLLLYFVFMSTGLCFVSFSRMGGVMAQTRVALNLSEVPVPSTSDHSLINAMGSHQCMSNFNADFNLSGKIQGVEPVCANEHANMAD